jgi:predicted phosphodiesterase
LFACNSKIYQTKIILLPDTQYYAEKYPEILDSQINWVLRNSKEIDFVLQQGDLTQNNNDREWEVGAKIFFKAGSCNTLCFSSR